MDSHVLGLSNCRATIWGFQHTPRIAYASLFCIARTHSNPAKQHRTERDGELIYYPIRAVLKSGDVLDTVYIVPERPYLKYWGVYPEADKGKRWVRIEDVVEVADSPTRLPARFADEIYRQGESGMGYTIFTVVFAGGQTQACVTGNAVDFIRYPSARSAKDVVAVRPHEGRRDDSLVKAPEWHWCLYSEAPE